MRPNRPFAALLAFALALPVLGTAAPRDPVAAAHGIVGDAPRPPQASGTLELGALLGIWRPSLASGLGDAYFRYDVPATTAMFGARLGYQLLQPLAVEVEVRGGSGALRGRDDFEDFGGEADVTSWESGGSATLMSLRGAVRWDLVTNGPALPFLRASVGADMARLDKAFTTDGWDTDWAIGLGAGLRLRLSHRLRLRVDVDWWLAEPAVTRATAPEPAPGSNVAVTAGLSWILGGPAADEDIDGVPDDVDRCPEQAEDKDGFNDGDGCPDLDNDGDAIPDDKDRCPNDAEDDDEFEDSDGCPDLDNDRDGIPDASDKCPNEPEDKDGFQDDDGCPDRDNDGDGIPDGADKCSDQAEDKDGFQDGDGCPDTDNDGDMVPDANDKCPNEAGDPGEQGCPSRDPDHDGIFDDADKCPNEAETYNGEADDDGCPDGEPLVRAHSGGIDLLQPLRFKGKRLAKGNDAMLRAVATVLARFGWPRLSVDVHGDDRMGGDKGRALTEARAKAVRDAIVSRGVSSDRLDARGYGDARPRCTDIAARLAGRPRDKAAVAACRAENERVELRVPGAN